MYTASSSSYTAGRRGGERERDRERERERDGDGGRGGGAALTPASPKRSSNAAPLPESCRARFGERERLRLEEDEWRRFFFFFFSFFWPAWKSKFRRLLASHCLIPTQHPNASSPSSWPS